MTITFFNNIQFGISDAEERQENGAVWKTVTILKTLDRPADYVSFAVAFAKYYRCRIARRVEYCREGYNKGCSVFTVECDEKTSRNIYRHGSTSRPNPIKAGQAELEEYAERFGTDRCEDPFYRPEYRFLDNRTGNVRRFDTLDDAREAAAREHATEVVIFANEPYSLGTHIVETVKPCNDPIA